MRARKILLFLITVSYILMMLIPLITELPKFFNSGDTIVLQFSSLDLNITFSTLFIIRIVLIIIVVMLLVFIQYSQIYKPFIKIEELRDKAFGLKFEPELKKIREDIIPDLRFNVMKKKKIVNFGKYLYIYKLYPIF